jgi:hypothetical protein
MIKHIVSGALMSVLVAGTIVSVNSAPASALPLLHVDVDAWQVTLQDGHHSTDNDQIGSVELKDSVTETYTSDAFTLAGEYLDHWRYRRGKVEYRIVMLGQPTPFWVKMSVEDHVGVDTTCDVYLGEPNAGGVVADQSPFTCSGGNPKLWEDHTRLKIHVGLNRDAEASGTILPTGGVSLANRTYKTYDVPYTRLGDESVPAGGTTTFDTVLRVGDKPAFDKQARTEFAYQIYDGGVPTKYWVAGLSTNYRGRVFNGDSRCGIYPSNPLAGESQLDQRVPLTDSPYTCSAGGSYQHGPHDDGNGHYDATFTVGRR